MDSNAQSGISEEAALRDMQKIRENWHEKIIAPNPPPVEKAEKWIAEQKEDGSWGDIDYKDKKRSGWSALQHIERIRELSVLYAHPKSALKGGGQVTQTIKRALSFWDKHRFQGSNWWYNVIAAPMAIGACFMVAPELFEEEPMRSQSLPYPIRRRSA